MFTVYAITHNGCTFEKTYIDVDYAAMVFLTATNCEDIKDAYIMDATTGEILVEM